LEEAYMIAELLWGYLVADYEHARLWMRVYKAIYFYFTPLVTIAYHRKYPDLIRRRLP
jgi:hypothetical protein